MSSYWHGQLVGYLSERKLFPELQSAYRAYHATETVVLRVLSDIFEALDRGDLAVLTLYLTNRRRSIPSITRRSFDACILLTVLATSFWAGSRHTCTAARSTSAAVKLLLWQCTTSQNIAELGLQQPAYRPTNRWVVGRRLPFRWCGLSSQQWWPPVLWWRHHAARRDTWRPTPATPSTVSPIHM